MQTFFCVISLFAKDDTVADNRTGLVVLEQGWLGMKRDADGCYVVWPLCIQAKRGELDGRGGEQALCVCVCVCGCGDSWCCYVLKFEYSTAGVVIRGP
jgi:hypothetical protein